jgi:riboflavin kinase/FMN adenylyltransferase
MNLDERRTIVDSIMAIETVNWDQTPPARCREGALTIGNFDGVHRGHRVLLAELRKQAEASGGPAVVLTFDPHPMQLLRPDKFQPLLTTVDDRAELLQANGAEHVVVLRTTPELLHLTANDFFARVVCNSFAARAVVEGVNFGFGRNREGTIQTLEQLCQAAGLGFVSVPPLQQEGVTVSSSRIRQVLLVGNVSTAAQLLGRNYRIRGTVGVGQRRGQTLGFPTANLEKIVSLIPADGVYAVRVLAKGSNYAGAANIGPNPTFAEQTRKVEVHLLDFQGDLYGQALAMDFVERLRDTRPFAGVTELVNQLRRDVDRARQAVERRTIR